MKHIFIRLCRIIQFQLELPVIFSQDTPGFIVNRLLVPYMAEAARLLERGIMNIINRLLVHIWL